MSDPYWLQTTPDADCPSLTDSQELDVAIIGGGLTGLHAALRILEETPRKKVALIEADRVCGDASGRTMGKVTTSHTRVFRRLSPDSGRLYVKANTEGFDRILSLIETYDIECDFKRVSNYLFTSCDSGLASVRQEYEAMKRSGLDVEWIEPRNAESREVPLEFLAGIRHPEQAIYHPRKFALGLLKAIRSLGGNVYEHTIATGLTEHCDGVTINIVANLPDDASLAAGTGQVVDDSLPANDGPPSDASHPVGTDSPSNAGLATGTGLSLKVKKAVVATRLGLDSEEPFADSLLPWRRHVVAYLFEDERLKNSYIRSEPPVSSLRSNLAALLLAGRDVDALPFEDEKHFHAIEAWAQQAYTKEIAAAMGRQPTPWWGEDTESEDMLPMIGGYRRDSKHAFMATGYSGWGMTKSAFAGIMLADLVAGRVSPYQESFDPWRF